MTKLQQKLARTYEEDGYSATLTFWAENQDEINALSEKERSSLKNMMIRYCRINGDEKNAAIDLAEKQKPQSKESIAFFFDFARIYHCGKNIEKDESKSERLCRMIFEQGDSDDLYRLGLMYKSGDGVSQDYAKAAECFQKVAVAGNKIAQFLLAEMYMRGLGMEKSRAEAEKWYTSANAEKDRYSEGLSHMTIPDGIEVIEESAFEGFENLRCVTIPTSVKSINYSAFKGCKSLEYVNFLNKSIYIEEAAFFGCTALNKETKETIDEKQENMTVFVETEVRGRYQDINPGSFVNQVITSSHEVLWESLATAVTRGDLCFSSTARRIMNVTVIVGLAGDIEGRVLFTMTLETAFYIASAMNFGEKFTEFDDMARATISEFANLITAQVATKLYEQGFRFDLTPPVLFVGEKMEVAAMSGRTSNVEAWIVPLKIGKLF